MEWNGMNWSHRKRVRKKGCLTFLTHSLLRSFFFRAVRLAGLRQTPTPSVTLRPHPGENFIVTLNLTYGFHFFPIHFTSLHFISFAYCNYKKRYLIYWMHYLYHFLSSHHRLTCASKKKKYIYRAAQHRRRKKKGEREGEVLFRSVCDQPVSGRPAFSKITKWAFRGWLRWQ